ncbi:response regulator transcription factor [Bordetella sp. FB-8]|uniref:response regulator n=1 Tax=Bordetella sp. FB-8 TaxID=1159870 RepID=UPI000377DF6F|nr:response regulator transcription factor [Bordetella sp. FB-8]
MMLPSLDVLLVDDHAVVRSGVRLMLSDTPDIHVTGEAASASEALDLITGHHFDVALVDIALPGRNGLDLLQALRRDVPGMAVLILSTYSEEIYAIRALRLGAAGYLTKDSPGTTLIEAIRKAATGGKYVSSVLTEHLASRVSGAPSGSHETLSNRELEVLKMIAVGKSLIEIAERMHLSPKTVTTYRARILEKIGVRSNVELARYASESGLLK